MCLLLSSSEYLNGYRRYVTGRRVGRPGKKAEKVFLLDQPTPILSLPPIGETVFLHQTVLLSEEYAQGALYDRYETDMEGKPIPMTLRRIEHNKAYFYFKIKGLKESVYMIPVHWITSGFIGWVRVGEFQNLYGKEALV